MFVAGSYRYQFTTAGTYYYWSGFVDNNQMIYLRGTIMVQDRSSSAQDISVRLAGHEALYIPASGKYIYHKFRRKHLHLLVSGFTDTLVFHFTRCFKPS